MNVDDDAAFVARAAALGRDRAALAALRAELAQRRADSGLFDMPGFAADFAAAVVAMARRHRQGLAPAALSVRG
jgi:predicted O-linked N-acetylglucosamine transferase (SPINDLY family)